MAPKAQAHDASKPFAFPDICAPLRADGPRRQGGLCNHACAEGGEPQAHLVLVYMLMQMRGLHKGWRSQCDGYPGVMLPDAQGLAPNPLQDMRHFKAMLRKVDNTFVKDLTLKPEDMEALQSGTWHEPPSICVHPMCKSAGWLLTRTCLMLCIADYEKAIVHAQVLVHMASRMIALRSVCCDCKCTIAGHDGITDLCLLFAAGRCRHACACLRKYSQAGSRPEAMWYM